MTYVFATQFHATAHPIVHPCPDPATPLFMKSIPPSGAAQLSTSNPVDHRWCGWIRDPCPRNTEFNTTFGPGSKLPVHTQYVFPPTDEHRSIKICDPSIEKSAGFDAPRFGYVCVTRTFSIVIRFPASTVAFIVSSQ